MWKFYIEYVIVRALNNHINGHKVAGAGVGIGLVFGSLIEATARNPSLRP